MEKRREFHRDAIEVCRHCKSVGTVEVYIFDGLQRVLCPTCGGSGLVRKITDGTITIEPYEKEEPCG